MLHPETRTVPFVAAQTDEPLVGVEVADVHLALCACRHQRRRRDPTGPLCLPSRCCHRAVSLLIRSRASGVSSRASRSDSWTMLSVGLNLAR